MHRFESGVATRALTGQASSGDRHLLASGNGRSLIAVIDGLGHGPEAERAALLAQGCLLHDPGASLVALVERCHQDLRLSRGVVMTLASIDPATGAMSWLGVGNVEAVLLRSDQAATPRRHHLLLRGGVVGRELPQLRTSEVRLRRGDTLVVATDGVRSEFVTALTTDKAPQALADSILARFGRDTDDALALVVRYRGGQP